ncbi:Ctr domain-containing protein [Rhizoctonia solani AG-1 IA]|uniref:Copper transport protein n=1 Tax=Thanatephorus cucumeris (strain AG1-IA) TaxID=983506 RepID=L8X1Y0_THACA|nr:Ctr domain-containing protein [Rhizoctonia solani AG-1 IA]
MGELIVPLESGFEIHMFVSKTGWGPVNPRRDLHHHSQYKSLGKKRVVEHPPSDGYLLRLLSYSWNTPFTMDHDHDSMGGSCTLWNWQTIDACFVSAQWHVRSKVGFAFSVIGVFLIVLGIEAFRRSARDYDRWVTTQKKIRLNNNSSLTQPTWNEQVVRGLFYGVQFSAAYILMLIAMSYKGGFVGYTLFGGDTFELGATSDAAAGGHSSACC